MTRALVATATLLCATGTSTVAAATYGDNPCSAHLSGLVRKAKSEELFWTYAVVGETVPHGLLSYSFLAGPRSDPTAMALVGSPVEGAGCNTVQVAVTYDSRSCEAVSKQLQGELGIRVDYTSENALILSGSALNPTNVTLLRGGAGCVLVIQHAESRKKP